jgi:hypothetical protein
MSFGVLTLATLGDYRKAIGLALSLRVSNPGVPVAVACSPKVRPLVAPFFDQVIDEDPSLRGFVHKVHLDRYSPFDDTFFFDSDVLVFRDLQPKVEEWGDQPYNACGSYVDGGISPFGLDRQMARKKLGKERLVMIDGAGHAYFRRPGSAAVFEEARALTRDYAAFAGAIRYADEDVMNIVLTKLGLRPRDQWGFFSRHLSAAAGTLKLDAAAGVCEMIEKSTGKPLQPYMMHFAMNEAPFPYAYQLRRLFKKFGADTSGLFRGAAADYWQNEIEWPARQAAKRALGRLGLTGR